MKTKVLSTILFLLVASLSPRNLFAQTQQQNLTWKLILSDSLFWVAYNNCDVEGMSQFLTEDVELYHDKAGVTKGRENLIQSLKTGICDNENQKLRREAMKGNIHTSLLKNSNSIYGAIMSGEHLFYVQEAGKEERPDGMAKFTHLWILQDTVWKMSRILSYEHGPAPYANRRGNVILADSVLNQFPGQYIASKAGSISIQKENDSLVLSLGSLKLTLFPQSDTVLFAKERDLTFEFSKDTEGTISKLVVRENGNIVEEATRKK